jgi:hypothetical protein
MPSAVQLCSARLIERLTAANLIRPSQGKGNLQELLLDLFAYLHVEPGCKSPPDFSVIDFANDLRRPVRVV